MSDLPFGYRWASEAQCQAIARGARIGHIVVPRTVDSRGVAYIQGEADIAVPVVPCDYDGRCPNPAYAMVAVLGQAHAAMVCYSHFEDATVSDSGRWYEVIDTAGVEAS